jgi:hypothetical protein
MVARFSGHRTAAVFKRYNIVEEQDLKAAVALLNRTPEGGRGGPGDGFRAWSRIGLG